MASDAILEIASDEVLQALANDAVEMLLMNPDASDREVALATVVLEVTTDERSRRKRNALWDAYYASEGDASV